MIAIPIPFALSLVIIELKKSENKKELITNDDLKEIMPEWKIED